MCRLSWNLGASTSWNPMGLSSPVMGLLYFTFYTYYCPSFNTHSLYLSENSWAEDEDVRDTYIFYIQSLQSDQFVLEIDKLRSDRHVKWPAGPWFMRAGSITVIIRIKKYHSVLRFRRWRMQLDWLAYLHTLVHPVGFIQRQYIKIYSTLYRNSVYTQSSPNLYRFDLRLSHLCPLLQT